MQPLVDQVNAFLATVPKFKVKDIQFTQGKTHMVGQSSVFGAWIVYEV